MKLTVGLLESHLRKFNRGTEIQLSCGCCHRSSIGEESILGIEDKTNQTYGYITLNFNNSSKAEVELSKDKEEFYIKEIEKLQQEVKMLNSQACYYKNILESIKRSAELTLL